MVRPLLLRGMLAGVLSGLLCFAFLKSAGEPAIDSAIAFEKQMDQGKAKSKAETAIAHAVSMPHDDCPATVVGQFRVAPSGAQLIMWTAIALVFGALTERAESAERGLTLKAAAV